MAGHPEIVATGSRVVYENRWMRVREDAIRRRDGSAGIYGVVEKPDFAVIVPIDGDRLHLVRNIDTRSGSAIGNFHKAPGMTGRMPICSLWRAANCGRRRVWRPTR